LAHSQHLTPPKTALNTVGIAVIEYESCWLLSLAWCNLSASQQDEGFGEYLLGVRNTWILMWVPGGDLVCDLWVMFFSKGASDLWPSNLRQWEPDAWRLGASQFLLAVSEITSITHSWKSGSKKLVHWRIQIGGHFGNACSSPACFLISKKEKVFMYLKR